MYLKLSIQLQSDNNKEHVRNNNNTHSRASQLIAMCAFIFSVNYSHVFENNKLSTYKMINHHY